MAHVKKVRHNRMGFPGSQRQSVDAWGVGCSEGDDKSRGKKNAVTASARHATCLVSPSPLVEFLQRFYLALSDSVSLYLFIYFGGLLPFRIVTLMSNRIGVSPGPNGGRLKLVRGRSTARCPPLSSPGK